MTRLIRLPTVLSKTGLKRATVYAEIAAGRFPKQILIGRRSVAWDEEAVDRWIRDRIAQHRDSVSSSENPSDDS